MTDVSPNITMIVYPIESNIGNSAVTNSLAFASKRGRMT